MYVQVERQLHISIITYVLMPIVPEGSLHRTMCEQVCKCISLFLMSMYSCVCLVVVAVNIIICQALNLLEPSMFHLELR